jgi:hypothetical protein
MTKNRTLRLTQCHSSLTPLAIGVAHHTFKQHKYARRYLAEAAYRFNRRFRLPEFMPRLLRAMVLCTPCPEPALRQATNFFS